jgi:KDO2-lipid IV(A) lauroyltransferase
MSVSFVFYLFIWKIFALLPEASAYRLAQFVADLATKRNSKSVKRLRLNYARIHPEFSVTMLDTAVKDGMRSYLRYWADTFRLHTWSDEHMIDSVTVHNEHFLRDALTAGTGCIVSLPHSGNWDHAGAYFSKTGAPVVTVAEHLEPEKLFLKFLSFRESLGMEVLDSSSHAFGVLAQRLRQGRLIALVADRDLSKNGVPVNFCGHLARMPAGPALLSIQTGAPLITAFVTYNKRGITISFEEPIAIPDTGDRSEKVAIMIQESANRLERKLKESVVDWHMLQRIWTDGDFVERE